MEIIEIMNEIRTLYMRSQDYVKALKNYERKLEIVTKTKGKYSMEIVKIMNEILNFYMRNEAKVIK